MLPHVQYTVYSLVCYAHFDDRRDRIRTYLLDHFDTKKIVEDYVGEMNKNSYSARYIMLQELSTKGIYSGYAIRKWLNENPETVITLTDGTVQKKRNVIVDAQMMNLWVEAKQNGTSTQQASVTAENGTAGKENPTGGQDITLPAVAKHNGYVGCSHFGRWLFETSKLLFIRHLYVFSKQFEKR